MEFCAVCVWYNPLSLGEGQPCKNISLYSNLVKKVYVVDNSNNDNSNLINGLENVEYIPLMKNCGIAKALNVGCQKALDEGFEWCMTMDQDSQWNPEQVKLYFQKVESKINSDSLIKSFGPRIVLPNCTSVLGTIKRKILHEPMPVEPKHPDEEFVDRMICSGNIIELQSWKEVEGFREEMFIDLVDTDFCYKLLENNYKLLMINTTILNHTLGKAEKPFYNLRTHSYFRMYYIFRNELYVSYLHPQFKEYHEYCYKEYVKSYLLFTTPKNFFKYLRLIHKAKKDRIEMIKNNEAKKLN